MQPEIPHAYLCPPDAFRLGYTFLRHIGLILDELSAQGLEVWLDEVSGWNWRWRGEDIKSERGFWAMGEAVVDAVATRFPTFSMQTYGEDVTRE